MLASAAGVFKNRRIYATGGNDNTVAIWDLTDHAKQLKVQPIGNGKCSRPSRHDWYLMPTIG
jgi:di- and tripeptidase